MTAHSRSRKGDYEEAIERTPEYNAFMADLELFHQHQGTGPLQREPVLGGKRLDMYRIYKWVTDAGGYEKLYQKYLYNYEQVKFWGKPLSAAKRTFDQLSKDDSSPIPSPSPVPAPPVSARITRTASSVTASPSTVPVVPTPASAPAITQPTPVAAPPVVAAPVSAPVANPLSATPADLSSAAKRPKHEPSGLRRSSSSGASSLAQYAQINSMKSLPPALTPLGTLGHGAPMGPPAPAPLGMARLNQQRPPPPVFAINPEDDGNDEKYLAKGPQSRLLLALESGLKNEVDWAFNKLIKLSHKLPTNYNIGANVPGLLESIVSFAEPFFNRLNLNTSARDFETTPVDSDIENVPVSVNGSMVRFEQENNKKPVSLPSMTEISMFNSKDSAELLERVLQVMHILRNLSFMEQNAVHLARSPTILTMLAKAIALPTHTAYVEIKQHSVDIFENLCPIIQLRSKNDFFVAALSQMILHSNDRYLILTSVRTLTRLAMVEGNEPFLIDVDKLLVKRMLQLLLLKDDELVSAVLDWFYQYSSLGREVATRIAEISGGKIVGLLCKMLRWKNGPRALGVAEIKDMGHLPVGQPIAPGKAVFAPMPVGGLNQPPQPMPGMMPPMGMPFPSLLASAQKPGGSRSPMKPPQQQMAQGRPGPTPFKPPNPSNAAGGPVAPATSVGAHASSGTSVSNSSAVFNGGPQAPPQTMPVPVAAPQAGGPPLGSAPGMTPRTAVTPASAGPGGGRPPGMGTVPAPALPGMSGSVMMLPVQYADGTPMPLNEGWANQWLQFTYEVDPTAAPISPAAMFQEYQNAYLEYHKRRYPPEVPPKPAGFTPNPLSAMDFFKVVSKTWAGHVQIEGPAESCMIRGVKVRATPPTTMVRMVGAGAQPMQKPQMQQQQQGGVGVQPKGMSQQQQQGPNVNQVSQVNGKPGSANVARPGAPPPGGADDEEVVEEEGTSVPTLPVGVAGASPAMKLVNGVVAAGSSMASSSSSSSTSSVTSSSVAPKRRSRLAGSIADDEEDDDESGDDEEEEDQDDKDGDYVEQSEKTSVDATKPKRGRPRKNPLNADSPASLGKSSGSGGVGPIGTPGRNGGATTTTRSGRVSTTPNSRRSVNADSDYDEDDEDDEDEDVDIDDDDDEEEDSDEFKPRRGGSRTSRSSSTSARRTAGRRSGTSTGAASTPTAGGRELRSRNTPGRAGMAVPTAGGADPIKGKGRPTVQPRGPDAAGTPAPGFSQQQPQQQMLQQGMMPTPGTMFPQGYQMMMTPNGMVPVPNGMFGGPLPPGGAGAGARFGVPGQQQTFVGHPPPPVTQPGGMMMMEGMVPGQVGLAGSATGTTTTGPPPKTKFRCWWGCESTRPVAGERMRERKEGSEVNKEGDASKTATTNGENSAATTAHEKKNRCDYGDALIVCEETFDKEEDLVKHVKAVHFPVGQKRYLCLWKGCRVLHRAAEKLGKEGRAGEEEDQAASGVVEMEVEGIYEADRKEETNQDRSEAVTAAADSKADTEAKDGVIRTPEQNNSSAKGVDKTAPEVAGDALTDYEKDIAPLSSSDSMDFEMVMKPEGGVNGDAEGGEAGSKDEDDGEKKKMEGESGKTVVVPLPSPMIGIPNRTLALAHLQTHYPLSGVAKQDSGAKKIASWKSSGAPTSSTNASTFQQPSSSLSSSPATAQFVTPSAPQFQQHLLLPSIPLDQHMDLKGIPLTAVLVLRNLARAGRQLHGMFAAWENDLALLMTVDGRFSKFVGQILTELEEDEDE
ncbi:Chromatin structure-remodeling complex protein rsc9 [Quaeritorhiza haematococci]|nr:Chromatin structure-remodeling complex protein rsc9 [Quaeritorhiza haematococci]